MSRGSGQGSARSTDQECEYPGAARTCPRAQARAGRVRAATLGVYLGVWGRSVWDLGCDNVSGYDGSAAVRRAMWDSPGLSVLGREMSD